MFEAFPKMGRLYREIVVTEKIDGTNAQVYITYANEIGVEGLNPSDPLAVLQDKYALAFKGGMAIYAGSRTKFIGIHDDNFGFANWVQDNADELFKLGEGRHFGEWWGNGIQRGYGLDTRKFSLFNTSRWKDERPACCDVVPELYRGQFDELSIQNALAELRNNGSLAAPGFMKPEGIITYHIAAGVGFKTTLEKDEQHKGQG